jgi:RimJ/RimL family protein N-acetyltransferase
VATGNVGYAAAGMARRPLAPPSEPPGDGTIVLRMRRAEDVPAIVRASHDPDTRRWLDDPPLSADDADALERPQERWRSGRGAPFVIADARTGSALGLVNIRLGDDEEVAGLGVSVFPEARGRGIASRALRTAATWALTERRLQRVFAEADVENAASIRAIEKAGFRREGVLRAHCMTQGRRHDCVMFSLVPADLGDAAAQADGPTSA